MTTLIPARHFALEHAWDDISNWLAAQAATDHRSHRALVKLEQSLEMIDNDLHHIEQYLGGDDPTPSALVSVHRLAMLWQGFDDVLHTKWQQAAVKERARRALAGIHEAFIGPVEATGQPLPDLVFAVSRVVTNDDFCGYIEAHRLERHTRWCNPYGQRPQVSITAVHGPAWVRDLYRHLVEDTVEGERLRRHYGNDAPSWHARGLVVSRAVTRPDADTLDAALSLWTPEEQTSPYQDLADAIDAAKLL